ncbi:MULTISPECIES: hypothetical protein [Nostocales]|uniref:Uncharacterized protein n=3 Tax=Nostocales TaxID=1161 RepID=A0A0C1QXG2_9CYAN|nr:hypothetical protein [Tolypothrix bouteillei]KAF3886106.1 hypothetical protein DA73_0400011960 [Tolypothrix bouteillei VB521301]
MNLETDNSQEIAQLKSEVITKRNQGEVVFEIKKITSNNSNERSATSRSLETSREVLELIDAFVNQQGYHNLGERWKEISQEEAEQIISFIMTKDLAYSVELMSAREAQQISAKVLTLFTGDCKYFTNASFVNNFSGMSEWDSITESTFDTGVIIVSGDRIGMLWVQDED